MTVEQGLKKAGSQGVMRLTRGLKSVEDYFRVAVFGPCRRLANVSLFGSVSVSNDAMYGILTAVVLMPAA